MIERKEEVPTAKGIMRRLTEKINFKGSLSFLRGILKELGFIWKRCRTNRTVLMERADVTVVRLRFLRKIRQYREEGTTIVYTDETYVHTTHSAKKCWLSEDASLKIPFERGERFIVFHAGCEGIISGAELVFKANCATGDYHNEMNFQNFSKWLKEKLIPNLPPRSVVVVDNASYHIDQVDKCPTQADTKRIIIDWLERNGIDFDNNMLKSELIEMCKWKRPEPRYILDETLSQHGHVCLRLPQYHAELNAIELIWAQVKGKVAQSNMSFKRADVEQLIRDAIQAVKPQDRANCCRHVEDLETQFCRSDLAVERAVDSFIVYISDEEGTETASETEDYTDTDTAFEMD